MTCPPLPVLTSNLATSEDWRAAREHFFCLYTKPGGGISKEDYNRAKQDAENYIYGQLAYYAKESGILSEEGKEYVRRKLETAEPVATTQISTPLPQVIAPSMPGPEAAAAPAPAPSAPLPVTTEAPMIGSIAGIAIPLAGSIVSGAAGSVCSGPYNFIGGMCIPKPDCKQRQPSDPCVAHVPGLPPSSGPGIPGITDPGFTGGTPLVDASPCPTGYTWNGSQCVKSGVAGAVERFLPGGATGTGMDVYGQAVVGAWGKPALQPYVASVPVRRCPRGTVLGKDGLCYDKIANKDRMWPRPPRPAFTGSDMKALRKAESLKKKAKDIASQWYSCKLK